MPTWAWVLVGVAAALLAGALILTAILSAARTRRLRGTFGPEYERAVETSDSRRDAERELDARRRRHDELDIRPLTLAARDRYLRSWHDTQASFVDDPDAALADADRLIQQVMAERGYPVESFDERADELSVEHPEVVQDYREAHTVALAREVDEADTEDVRRAMQVYRALFERLLETEHVT